MLFSNKRNIEALWGAIDMINEHLTQSDKLQDDIVEFMEHTSARVNGIETDIYGDANYIVAYTILNTQNYETFSSYIDADMRIKEVKKLKGVDKVYISEIIDRGSYEAL